MGQQPVLYEAVAAQGRAEEWNISDGEGAHCKGLRHWQIAELQVLVHGSSVEHVDMTSGFGWSPISRSSAVQAAA